MDVFTVRLENLVRSATFLSISPVSFRLLSTVGSFSFPIDDAIKLISFF